MDSYDINTLQIGQIGYIEKTISETDVYNYAGVTGDFSWLHVNEVKAREGRFGGRIVHGMLLIGMISGVVGTKMPGNGTIYVSQSIKFIKPTYIGDTIRAQTKVIEIDQEKGRATLETICINQHGEVVLKGEAVVIPPKIRAEEPELQKPKQCIIV